MNERLREARRRAAADPRDLQARAAYAAELLRVGHQAAALQELTVARRGPRAWASPVMTPRIGDARDEVRLHVAGVGECVLDLEPFAPWSVAPADVDDARWPGAMLIPVRPGALRARAIFVNRLPLSAVPWPTCPDCAAGARSCAVCRGAGATADGPCATCASEGEERCTSCDGEGTLVARFEPSGCEHVTGPTEWSEPTLAWRLVRCARCGLAALRKKGALAWAHAVCGRFVCACATSAAGASTPPA